MIDDETRVEILRYYLPGRVCDPAHDRCTIRYLKDCGYLRSGITPELEETLKTTDLGRICLQSYGIRIPGGPYVLSSGRLWYPPWMKGRPLLPPTAIPIHGARGGCA